MDLYGEDKPLQFYDKNHELRRWISPNPFDVEVEYENWKAYKDLTNALLSDKDALIEILSECGYWIETEKRKGYNLEMEALSW